MLRKSTMLLPPLRGGCRYTDNVLSIAKDEAFRLINMHIDSRGIAYTRGGSTLLNSTGPTGDITSIHQYNRPYGAGIIREVLVTIGKKWYKMGSDNLLIQIGGLTSSNKPSVVTFNDGSGNSIAILANGVDFLKYDGSDVSSLLTNFADDFVSSNVPRYLFVYGNRLMASGCDDYPTRVYASNSLDPTTWGVSSYFSYDDGRDMEPVTGMGSAWSFLVVGKKNSIYINTEGDPESDTLEQIKVAIGSGITSHWSIVTEGNIIRFVNQEGFYEGILRRQVEDGLEVRKISDNIEKKFRDVDNYDEIEGVHDRRRNEILWGAKTSGSSTYNTGFAYNLALSGIDENGTVRHVWNGWYEGDGFEAACLENIIASDGSESVYRGGSGGKIYIMEPDYVFKDDDSSGTGKDIKSTIHLGPIVPGGPGIPKSFRTAYVLLHQNVNGSTTFAYNIAGRYRGPISDLTLKQEGNVPFWDGSSDPSQTQVWDSTIWADKGMLDYKMSINGKGAFIELIIENSGNEDTDSISYGGAQLVFQYRRLR